ncbi:MAG: tetratricopeptide repeat protein [Betaproteobacteria bacterium]|nr:tetratricopeptide repeat protein [Betaproteobacteria bacterium]
MLGRLMRQIFGGARTVRAAALAAPLPAEDALTLHARAKDLYLKGDPAAAIPLYFESLELVPGLTEARFHLGVALAAIGDTESALRQCLAAIEDQIDPPADWFDSARRLADGLGGQDIVVPDGGDTARQIRRGNALRSAGRFVEAEAAYRETIARDESSRGEGRGRDQKPSMPAMFARHRLACMLAVLDRMNEADELFAQAAKAGIAFDESLHFAAKTLDLPAGKDASRSFSGALVAPGPEPVVLLSGDPLYLRRFAPALLSSLLTHARFQFALQVHVIDPDPSLDEDLKFTFERLGLPVVAFSSERFEGNSSSQKTAYACARYRLLHRLLTHTWRPVLVLDLDILVLEPLLAPDLGQCDAAWIRMHDTRWDPWDAESASLAWFMPTQGGVAVAKIISQYIVHELAEERSPWFLDQIALFAARARASRFNTPPVIEKLPRSILVLPHEYARGNRGTLLSLTHSLAENNALLAQRPFLDFVPSIKRCFGWVIPGHDIFFDAALRGAPIVGGRARWEHH